jgi:hypothetical protein
LQQPEQVQRHTQRDALFSRRALPHYSLRALPRLNPICQKPSLSRCSTPKQQSNAPRPMRRAARPAGPRRQAATAPQRLGASHKRPQRSRSPRALVQGHAPAARRTRAAVRRGHPSSRATSTRCQPTGRSGLPTAPSPRPKSL